jgi:vacuolar-type H+-ATPase subunit F/Vma7
MRLVVLSDGDDARGFRLAGVDTIVCRTRADVDRALAERRRPDRSDVMLVSERVYRLAPTAIDARQNRPGWPLLVVLPGASEGDDS